MRRADEDLGPPLSMLRAAKAATEPAFARVAWVPVFEYIFGIDGLDSFRTLCSSTWGGARMPRFKVVATVVLALALALMLASCSDTSTDSVDEGKVAARQKKLEQAHGLGVKAHTSMAKYDFEATESECKAHYAATMANDLGSDAMVDVGRRYFVAGCMEELGATGVAQGP